MSKKDIVENILMKYTKFGLSRIEVEISYLLDILWRVPKDSIYPGMQMIFNNLYGIKDEAPEIEAGKALFTSALNDVRAENPEATDSDIAKDMEYVGIDTLEASLEEIDFKFLGKVKDAMLQSTKQFVSENV